MSWFEISDPQETMPSIFKQGIEGGIIGGPVPTALNLGCWAKTIATILKTLDCSSPTDDDALTSARGALLRAASDSESDRCPAPTPPTMTPGLNLSSSSSSNLSC
ncbi:MAG: hypothetical protein M1823_004672 [Watsoniomyces obsoletus]|nr:MAG: hypothetical protein M1823_004672 [Watsoniomyces obsoletus]